MTESEAENLSNPGKDSVERHLKKDVARGVLVQWQYIIEQETLPS
ncbi:hypothetical protein [Brevibacterium aurantiacum]|nr:hypothetical protein [Brevibacterium aurantiacum]